MALAIGIAIKCKSCIQFHIVEAVKAGANQGEILEAAGVAIFMGGRTICGPYCYRITASIG